MKKDATSRKGEIFRFVITGLVAAITSFLFDTLTSFLLQKCGMDSKSLAVRAIATIVAFIFGVLVNYILSVNWVFQNVDKKEQEKHKKSIGVMFVVLSAVGMGLSTAVMIGLKQLWLTTLYINIDEWMIVKDLPTPFFQKIGAWIKGIITSGKFWLYALSFVLNALVGLIWNYFSRKKWLFKEPKKNGNN